MVGKIVVDYLSESWWNPEGMVPGMPGKPEEPGPNPQSCDADCSQVENGIIRDV